MTEEQYKKLDSCHFPYSLDQRCVEEEIAARHLLGSYRFDLYAILLYIDYRVKGVQDMSFARRVYMERTRAITGFKFSEIGNNEKNTLEDYFTVLDNLISAFQNGTYDEERTFIPVDKDYELIDGAHRVSCAAYFGRRIKILRFIDCEISRVTSENLLSKFLPISVADSMALEATRWHEDLYMLMLWPKSFDHKKEQEEAKRLIYSKTDVIYEKTETMTLMGIRNLMLQIYGHMSWIGTLDDDYDSTYKKADEVWAPHGRCCFILTRASSTDYVLQLKSHVRGLFQIGLASIHSTDNIRETRIAANAIYNPNSFHFLNNSKPTKYKKSYHIFEVFKERIVGEDINIDDFIIDSSMILAIFGVREANDLDYYSIGDFKSYFNDLECVEEHDGHQRQFYDIPIKDLIFDVSNHFVFNEIKFVSLERLLSFKQNRYNKLHDSKDAGDIKIIKMLLSGKENKFQVRMVALKLSYKRLRRLFIREYYDNRNKLLKKLGIFDFLRNLRNLIRNI